MLCHIRLHVHVGIDPQSAQCAILGDILFYRVRILRVRNRRTGGESEGIDGQTWSSN